MSSKCMRRGGRARSWMLLATSRRAAERGAATKATSGRLHRRGNRPDRGRLPSRHPRPGRRTAPRRTEGHRAARHDARAAGLHLPRSWRDRLPLLVRQHRAPPLREPLLRAALARNAQAARPRGRTPGRRQPARHGPRARAPPGAAADRRPGGGGWCGRGRAGHVRQRRLRPAYLERNSRGRLERHRDLPPHRRGPGDVRWTAGHRDRRRPALHRAGGLVGVRRRRADHADRPAHRRSRPLQRRPATSSRTGFVSIVYGYGAAWFTNYDRGTLTRVRAPGTPPLSRSRSQSRSISAPSRPAASR